VAVIARHARPAPFWTLPPAFLTGTSVAAGIALINLAAILVALPPVADGMGVGCDGVLRGGLIVGAVPVIVRGDPDSNGVSLGAACGRPRSQRVMLPRLASRRSE